MENLSLNSIVGNVTKAAIFGAGAVVKSAQDENALADIADASIFGAGAVVKSAQDENALADIANAAIKGPAGSLIDVQDDNKSDNNFVDFIKMILGVIGPIK